jgi:hypothetical protein
VDREERPDVDHVYMTALNAMGNRGGWPLSMFLMPDGRPIVGGTYWPREDREVDTPEGKEKVRGFKTILGIVQKFHTEEPQSLDKQADQLAKATTDALAGAVRGLALIELNRDLVTAATAGLKEEFDEEYGGFGSRRRKFEGPKFPTPPALRLLQGEAARTKAKDLDTMLAVTLDHMARGGIYDHLGGGFHRYSTERTWTVPHFEKMLYDNAQLCEVYADAYRRTKNPLYKRVLEGTMAFVERELSAPEGGFYSALDADSEGEEGKFYVWTGKQIDEALGNKDDAALLKKVYGADGKPNFEEKYHILVLAKPLGETAAGLKMTGEQLEAQLAPLRAKLLAARAKRARPFLDTKVLTAWNGQMIAGAARAGEALGEKKYIDRAVRAAKFVLREMRTPDGRLLRSYGAAPGRKPAARLNAYLDDYAFLVHGLLTLHDVTKDKQWLDEAKALTDTMVKYHLDEEQGGFFYTSKDHEKLFARAKDQHDGAQPSGNSLAAQNLVRLWVKTGDERYAKLADKTIKALAAPLKMSPTSLPALAEALALYLDQKKK